MTRDAWMRLVERFANGRALCNCREAYYDADGRCAFGCSANLINTKYEIAAAIEKDRAEREAVVEAARDWIRDRETESAAFGSDADLKAFRRIERALPSPPSEER